MDSNARERQRKYRREYYQRPEVKARQKERMRIYHKEYYQRPEVKKHRETYHKSYQKEYYQRPEVKKSQRDYMRNYMKRPKVKRYYRELRQRTRMQLREKFFEMYGSACSCCGEMEKRFLTLDHINENGHIHRKKKWSEGVLRDAISRFTPDEYQVLCFNCNAGRALNHGVCPHSPNEPETSIWDTKPSKGMRQRRNLRKRLFEKYGAFCSCCGESNARFLTLDHKLNDGSLERKMAGGNKSLKLWRKALREYDPNKYQILCFNCNCGRAVNNGVCPHIDNPPLAICDGQ